MLGMFAAIFNVLRLLWRSLWREFRMDINSLPDEMLTNVLKYTTFEKGRQLRKLDQRIDRLAKRNDFFRRLPVVRLEIDSLGFLIEYVKSNSKVSKYMDGRNGSNPDYPKILDQWLSRVEILEQLKIFDIAIDADCMLAFRRNKRMLRKLPFLVLKEVDFRLSKSEAIILMQGILTAVRDLAVLKADKTLEKLFCEEVLGNRYWDGLSFDSYEITVNNDFLLNIAPNCKLMWFWSKTNTCTISGAIKMLEKCTLDGKITQIIGIGDVQMGAFSIEDIKELFASKFPFVNTTVHTCSQENHVKLKFKEYYSYNIHLKAGEDNDR